MARQSNAAYWAQRMKTMESALLDHSYGYVENLEKQFSAAQAEIDRKIARWYQRFADNNEIDLAEAKKRLTAGELEEFRWSVDEYIRYGRENALDGAWMRELENASARVHISRLEALKLELQQQAEALYGNQLDEVDRAVRRIYEDSYYHTAFELQKGLGVGCSMQALNKSAIEKVLSRPWTADDQTFRDRCWTNKQSLVNTVNTQLTQMIIRGEAPDRTIAAIAKQFDVSKAKAGRLVMTESAYFASAAQRDCFASLDVERYRLVASFDHDTCALCGDLDGKVFKMSEYAVGLTAPPFHPWCRCCTCPYFEDMEGIGERWTRSEDGSTQKVPAEMTYSQWKAAFVEGSEKSKLTKPAHGAILKPNTPDDGGAAVQTVGYIDREIYSCITKDITTDEVILTPERVQHIEERHPGHFERIQPFLQLALEDPDYILADKNPNTGLILKMVEREGTRFQTVLRVHTSADNPAFKNSIISSWEISESRWENYIKNKTILYKKE